MLQNEQQKRLGVDTFNRRIWHICKSSFLLSIVIVSSGAELSADCSHTALWCCLFWSNRKLLQSFPRKEWLTQWQHKGKSFWNRKGLQNYFKVWKCARMFLNAFLFSSISRSGCLKTSLTIHTPFGKESDVNMCWHWKLS